MDNPSPNQEQQPQPPPPPSAAKNIRNLSIKEFFTTRLMRTRSFEGSGAHSPKDETTNWFDEFKARMTKKSQANTSKQQQASGSANSGGAAAGTCEEVLDETVDPSTCSETAGVRFAPTQSKSKHRHKDDNVSSSVKDSCDTYLSRLAESGESEDDSSPEQCQSTESKDTSNYTSKLRKAAGLRARKLPRISSAESPDFDTASINTIFNRRDSRFDRLSRKPHRLFLSKILGLVTWIISYLIPFNYNLPWKLLTLINCTFVIIVIGMTGQTSKDEVKAFTFLNGFICGVIVATVCLVVVLLSLLVKILPTSQKSSEDVVITDTQIVSESPRPPNISPITDRKLKLDSVPVEPKQEDFSLFEVLDGNNSNTRPDGDAASRSENLLDDDDYKGWMIEFIGDYELRNKSDIKLKLIFVRVENRILYLCKPKNNHDVESSTFPVFAQQRIYDLNTVKKFSANLLLPRNVRNRQKWVWSKKYPIRLEFQEDTTNEQAIKPTEGSPKIIQLTLFAKSCREKEEWFRRFKRIVEENKVASGQSNKRLSLQSESSAGNDDGSSSSVKNFRSRSPFSTSSVHSSRSSHILNDLRKVFDDGGKLQEHAPSGLIRTKSCEQLHDQASTSTSSSNQDQFDEITPGIEAIHADDSTLTRETAEVFSQAVEYSNFIDSLPNLDYREYIERVIESGQEATPTSDWFNALIGRIFFDVFSHNYWSYWFKRKIQRKLHRIRLPYFMETLTLTKIDLGTNAPQFLNVVSHSFDSFGLSIDFDMSYSGGLTMTFETKLNLLKIKSDNASANTSNTSNQPTVNITTPTCSNPNSQIPSQSCETNTKDTTNNSTSDAGFLDCPSEDANKPSLSSSGSTRTSGESSDSEESESDSSSESSSDEADVDEISDWEDYGAEKTRQSIVRFVDKIASSRYFQQATENRYIKKKLQDISNCPLVLVVQIQSLNGVLTLNVPPPQTDRIWYGFKPNPELTLKALPKMGDREVNLSHVTDWIERKLAEEFRKILVIPNMEDIVLPVLKSDHLLYVTTTK